LQAGDNTRLLRLKTLTPDIVHKYHHPVKSKSHNRPTRTRPSEAELLPITTGNLPAPATPLVGRRRAARDLAAQLAEARLVTLSGPGGCGKTRLALHVAGTVGSRLPAGAWWCDLSPLAATCSCAFRPITWRWALNRPSPIISMCWPWPTAARLYWRVKGYEDEQDRAMLGNEWPSTNENTE
jgi:hypothetical protein